MCSLVHLPVAEADGEGGDGEAALEVVGEAARYAISLSVRHCSNASQ